MSCVVIKLVPRTCCCSQPATTAQPQQPTAAASTPTTTADPAEKPAGVSVPFAAAASAEAAETEEKKASLWKWALVAGIGVLAVFGDGKEKNGKTNTKKKKK